MSDSPPSWLARGALGAVAFYKKFLSRLLHLIPGSGCRFYPTCSCYMATSLERFGFLKGVWLGLKRLGRCHPWGGSGVDEVPEK